MSRRLRQGWSRGWLLAIGAINLALVVVTYFRFEIWDMRGFWANLIQFNLTSENNVATWWSGMFLMLIALHAFDGFHLLKSDRPRAARGWAALAFVLVALSADEIGSLHERADMMAGLGTWLSLLPFALVLVGMMGYGLLALWSDPTSRRRVVWIVVGFGLLGSVALQEFVEHNLTWSPAMESLRGAVEEGTELAGMTILLWICMRNTRGVFARRSSAAAPVFETVDAWRTPLTLVAACVAPPLAWISSLLPDQDRGHPSDWLAAALCLMAAVGASRLWLVRGSGFGPTEGLLTASALFASAAAVVIPPLHRLALPGMERSLLLRPALVALLCLTLLVVHAAVGRRRAVPVLSIAAVLALVASFGDHLFWGYFIPVAYGVLTYAMLASAESAPARLSGPGVAKTSAA